MVVSLVRLRVEMVCCTFPWLAHPFWVRSLRWYCVEMLISFIQPRMDGWMVTRGWAEYTPTIWGRALESFQLIYSMATLLWSLLYLKDTIVNWQGEDEDIVSGVSTVWCIHCLVYPLSGVSTVWCIHCLVYPLSGVSTVWCIHCLVYPLSGVSTVWCIHCLVYPLSGVSTVWCIHCLVYPLSAVDN